MSEQRLEDQWERHRDLFTVLSKPEFDRLARDKQFAVGPKVGSPSKFMSEFGPYSPSRFAFGELVDGRWVCCDVAAEAAEGE